MLLGSHEADSSALREASDKRTHKKIPTRNLIKMAEFVLINNFLEFDTNVYQQISGTAIGTNFAPPFGEFLWTNLKPNF